MPTPGASGSTVRGASPSDLDANSTQAGRKGEISDLYHDAGSQTNSGAMNLEGYAPPPLLATAQDAERIADQVISHLSDRYYGLAASSQDENLSADSLHQPTSAFPVWPEMDTTNVALSQVFYSPLRARF